MASIKEHEIQQACVDLLRAHNVLHFAVPNEAALMAAAGERKRAFGLLQRLRSMGLRAGVADLVLLCRGRAYMVEVKTPAGRMSEKQQQFALDCNAADIPYAIVHSVDELTERLRAWQIIR